MCDQHAYGQHAASNNTVQHLPLRNIVRLLRRWLPKTPDAWNKNCLTFAMNQLRAVSTPTQTSTSKEMHMCMQISYVVHEILTCRSMATMHGTVVFELSVCKRRPTNIVGGYHVCHVCDLCMHARQHVDTRAHQTDLPSKRFLNSRDWIQPAMRPTNLKHA